jgi:O-antigen ligase
MLLLSPLSMNGDKPMLLRLALVALIMILITQQYLTRFRQSVFVPTELPVRFYLAFIGLIFLSLFWTISNIASLTTALIFLSGLMTLVLVYNWSQQQVKIQVKFFKIIVLVLSCITIYQAFFSNLSVNDFSGLFKDRNTHASFMVMLLIPICCQYLNKELTHQSSVFLSFLITFVTFAVALTNSRGAILSLIIDFSLLSGLFLIHKQERTVISIIKLAVLLTIGILLATVLLKQGIVARVLSSEMAIVFGENTGRGGLWSSAWKMFLDHPVLGWGINSFFLLFPQYKPALNTELGLYVHNDYLQFLSELGLVGVFLFLGFIFSLFFSGYQFATKAKNPEQKHTLSFLVACFGMLVHTAFNFNLYQISIHLLMGFYIGRFLFDTNMQPYSFVPAEKTTFKSYYGLTVLTSMISMAWLINLGVFFYFANQSNEQGNTQQGVESMEIANAFYPHTGVYESKKAMFAMSQLNALKPEEIPITNTEILHDLNTAIEKNSSNAFNYVNRAQILIAINPDDNKNKIIADFEKALKINPADLGVRNRYIQYLNMQQQEEPLLKVLWAGWGRVYILTAETYQDILNYLQLLQNYNTKHGKLNNNAKVIKVRSHILNLVKNKSAGYVYLQ